jgi:peptide/nickel transport system substrate-binding protein
MSSRSTLTEGSGRLSRRRVLGSLGTAGGAALAGCGGDGDGDGTEGTGGDGGTSGGNTTTPTEQVQMDGELVATFGADVANFDPVQQNDTTSTKAFGGLVYEYLMQTDFDGQPQPYLATSVEQVDDVTFRANLREGVMFHNGSELTADDVKATFERYEGTPREADVYDWYETSEVVDDYTLEITLQDVYAPFKFALGGVPITPAAVADGDVDLSENPVGTGAYTFEEHQPDSLFRLSRNEDYWFEAGESLPDRPPIETLTFRVIVEQSAAASALQAGDVDLINDPPAGSVSDYKQDDSIGFGERIAGGYDMFVYPMHEDAETPFQNRKVRQGVNRLIPREAIVEAVYDGQGIPAYSPISPLAQQFTSEELNTELGEEYAKYDTDQATTLLEEGFSQAGFDRPFSTEIISNQNPQRVQWAQLIQEEMNNTEFWDVSFSQFEWNTYIGKILAEDSHQQNQIVAVGWSAGWDPDDYIRNVFHSDQFTPNCCNINHYSNDEIDQLIDDGVATYDIGERQSIYEELQRTVVEESPLAFTRFDIEQDAWHADTVNGFRTYPINGGEYYSIYSPYSGEFTWVSE